jgi:hypothetical protein
MVGGDFFVIDKARVWGRYCLPMRFSVVVSVLVLAFGLSGCGSNANSVADSKNASGLTPANFLAELSKAHQAQTSVFTELNVHEGERALTMKGPVVWGAKPATLALDIASSNSETDEVVRMILVGDAFYLQGKRGMPEGKFVKFDLTDPMNGATRQGDFLRDQLAPAGFVSELAAAKPDVTFLGDGDVIDGIETTRWRVRVNDAELTSLTNAIRSGSNMEFTLWVGRDKLLRKMTTKVQGGTLKQSWREWGEHSAVGVPAGGEVLDTAGLEADR